jgi:hypothetical protein
MAEPASRDEDVREVVLLDIDGPDSPLMSPRSVLQPRQSP